MEEASSRFHRMLIKKKEEKNVEVSLFFLMLFLVSVKQGIPRNDEWSEISILGGGVPELVSNVLGLGAELLLNPQKLVVFGQTLRPGKDGIRISVFITKKNGKVKQTIYSNSIQSYLQGAPVLIWPVQRPTTKSAMKQSSVSPERWDTIVPQPRNK